MCQFESEFLSEILLLQYRVNVWIIFFIIHLGVVSCVKQYSIATRLFIAVK